MILGMDVSYVTPYYRMCCGRSALMKCESPAHYLSMEAQLLRAGLRNFCEWFLEYTFPI